MQLPSAKRNETVLQGMGKAFSTLGANMLLFGGVACIFTATEAAMEVLRGHSDWKNGVVAGLTAGVTYKGVYLPKFLLHVRKQMQLFRHLSPYKALLCESQLPRKRQNYECSKH
jgi:hypothetical protein